MEALDDESISKPYRKRLEELSTDPLTLEHKRRIADAATLGPMYLGRTASRSNGDRQQQGNKTNGSTSVDLLQPAANTHNDECLYDHIADLSQGEMVFMLSNHLAWTDLRGDEFLSYSKDMLFLVMHALRKHDAGQGGVTIQFVDRRKAKTVDGSPAAFYPALELYTAFEIQEYWYKTKFPHQLDPHKFSQEFLSHHVVLYDDPTLCQANIKDLIRDGLFDIAPFLEVPAGNIRPGLYTAQVVSRGIGFPRPHEKCRLVYSYDRCSMTFEITLELLQTVRRVAMNFVRVPDGVDAAAVDPPLHIFLSFLTFEKRATADPVFMEWIRTHYTAQDVAELYTAPDGTALPGFVTVGSNLPGYMQYLDLIRDCCTLFDLAQLPPNVLETPMRFHSGSWMFDDYDHAHHREQESSTPWHEDKKDIDVPDDPTEASVCEEQVGEISANAGPASDDGLPLFVQDDE